MNIALVNELAQLCDRMGIDVWEVVDAAATKPFGFMRFEPGPRDGRPLPAVDPFYLAFKAREHDFYTEFVELAGKLNQAQPHFCVERIERTLNDASQAGPGLAGPAARASPTRRGVGDLREAPALKIIRLLRSSAPTSPTTTRTSRSCSELGLKLGRARRRARRPPIIACIVTAHPEVDHERVVREAQLVLDFRGVTRGIEAPNLVRL